MVISSFHFTVLQLRSTKDELTKSIHRSERFVTRIVESSRYSKFWIMRLAQSLMEVARVRFAVGELKIGGLKLDFPRVQCPVRKGRQKGVRYAPLHNVCG